jgi:hypothetical protein
VGIVSIRLFAPVCAMGTLRDRLARWRWVLAFFPRTGGTRRGALRRVFLLGALDAAASPSCSTPAQNPRATAPRAKVELVAARRPAVRCRGGPLRALELRAPWRSRRREERGQGGRVVTVSGGSRGPPPGPRGWLPPPRARAGGTWLLQIRAGKLGRRS